MPPLSNIARVMQSLYSGDADKIDMKRLIKMIESDVMLTANILKMINSPYYGFRGKISSVSQAVTLFGVQKIYAFVIHFAMNNHLKVDTAIYGFNNAQFNEMCILQSSLMMQWYALVNLRDSHILTSLALIMESGKLIVSKELYASEYLEVYRKGFLQCTNIPQFEEEFLGTTSYYLSALLFKHWNLEPVYSEILKELDGKNYKIYINGKTKLDEAYEAKIKQYAKAIDVIRTAVNLKEVLTEESIKKASALVDAMGLDGHRFKTVAERIRKKYEES
jgi:HD-like signal output (HDOD) protein